MAGQAQGPRHALQEADPDPATGVDAGMGMAARPTGPGAAGRRLAQGVARGLLALNHMSVAEFVPAPGLRVDLMALGPKGEIWIVECKSCRADFTSDRKWRGYLPWCDRFFWAVDADFPTTLLPPETGMILADGFGAELVRMPVPTPLAPARRKALTLALARAAALRLQALRDPQALSGAAF